MFVRKLYYDPATGDVLESHMRQGDVRMTTFAEDDTGCMVWTEPDAAVEAAFAACYGVSVDVTQTPHAVIWEYAPADVEVTA